MSRVLNGFKSYISLILGLGGASSGANFAETETNTQKRRVFLSLTMLFCCELREAKEFKSEKEYDSRRLAEAIANCKVGGHAWLKVFKRASAKARVCRFKILYTYCLDRDNNTLSADKKPKTVPFARCFVWVTRLLGQKACHIWQAIRWWIIDPLIFQDGPSSLPSKLTWHGHEKDILHDFCKEFRGIQAVRREFKTTLSKPQCLGFPLWPQKFRSKMLVGTLLCRLLPSKQTIVFFVAKTCLNESLRTAGHSSFQTPVSAFRCFVWFQLIGLGRWT